MWWLIYDIPIILRIWSKERPILSTAVYNKRPQNARCRHCLVITSHFLRLYRETVKCGVFACWKSRLNDRVSCMYNKKYILLLWLRCSFFIADTTKRLYYIELRVLNWNFKIIFTQTKINFYYWSHVYVLQFVKFK